MVHVGSPAWLWTLAESTYRSGMMTGYPHISSQKTETLVLANWDAKVGVPPELGVQGYIARQEQNKLNKKIKTMPGELTSLKV